MTLIGRGGIMTLLVTGSIYTEDSRAAGAVAGRAAGDAATGRE